MMKSTLPWFSGRFPLYLAPMAGVSDKIFRQLCKEYGADVITAEFVAAEGIVRRNERTRDYLDFDEIERPIGVQLFGANADHMAEAARQVIDWVRPDFVDLNFGCPVNKVVAKNGGSALLKDCQLSPASQSRSFARSPRCRSRRRSGLDGTPIQSTPRASRAFLSMQESLRSPCMGAPARKVTPARLIGTSSAKLPPRFPFPLLEMAISPARLMWRNDAVKPEFLAR